MPADADLEQLWSCSVLSSLDSLLDYRQPRTNSIESTKYLYIKVIRGILTTGYTVRISISNVITLQLILFPNRSYM